MHTAERYWSWCEWPKIVVIHQTAEVTVALLHSNRLPPRLFLFCSPLQTLSRTRFHPNHTSTNSHNTRVEPHRHIPNHSNTPLTPYPPSPPLTENTHWWLCRPGPRSLSKKWPVQPQGDTGGSSYTSTRWGQRNSTEQLHHTLLTKIKTKYCEATCV